MNALSAPPFPTNPTLGQWHGNWCWNGARWVATPMSGVRVLTTVFNAPGTFPYMPSPGLVSLTVECVGGGGGGGGGESTIPSPGAAGWLCAGGGGGSGGYSRTTVAAALVAGGVQVVVGAGGAAGTPTVVGGAGGTTSFGAFCVAEGGNGGTPGNIGVGSGYGGWWAGSGIGDIASPGNSGGHGMLNFYDPAEEASGQSICFGGNGAASFFGSAPPGAQQAPGGVPGIEGWMGAGGSGGCGGGAGPGPQNGGAGGAGLCIITEYCWNDTDGGEVNPPIEVNARVAVTHVPPPCPPNPCPPGWTEFDGD